MPAITLAEALRYFFSPFILYFYLAIYDKRIVIKLAHEFGPTGMIAFLVAGSVIYFVYRFLICDYLIEWLFDIFRRETYRRYIGKKYNIGGMRIWLPWHTARAERIASYVRRTESKFQAEWVQMSSAGIHLLYQAGSLALPFACLTLFQGRYKYAGYFTMFAIGLILIGALRDMQLEDDQLVILRAVPDKIDDAAQLLNIAKR